MAISTNYAFGVAVKQMQDVQAQIAKWTKVVRAAGIQAE